MKYIQNEPIELVDEVQFIELKENYKREQKIIYTCTICKRKVQSTLRLMSSYNKPCSTCSSKAAIKEKYGVDNVFQLEDVKKKIKETNLERYGTEYPFSFGGEQYKSFIKNKYGVDNVFQSEEIKNKIRNTCKEKYGVDYVTQSDIVKDKIKDTCKEKYGVTSALASPEIREKINATNIEKYGRIVAVPFGSNEYKKIIKEIYGVDNVSQASQIKKKKEQTCLEHFGVANPFEASEVKEKIKQTLIQKYGVEHALQYPEFFKKSKIKYIYNNIPFDSSWELAYWVYTKEVLRKTIIHEPCSFIYEYNGNKYTYYPDFMIDGKLYEIKGDHFFENGKMINPWNRDLDDKAQAKYLCMLENNVIILKYIDVKIALDYIHETYGDSFLEMCRRYND